MVFAVPDFSSRSRRGGPICGTCFTGALWWRVWLASSPPVRATAIPALAFHSLMQMHFLYSGVSTQFHGSSYGGAAELRGDVVAWLACLFPSIRAHRMGLVEVVPAPAMPWPRQAQYCTIGSSSAVCGGSCGACGTSVWLTPSTLRFPTPVHGYIPMPYLMQLAKAQRCHV